MPPRRSREDIDDDESDTATDKSRATSDNETDLSDVDVGSDVDEPEFLDASDAESTAPARKPRRLIQRVDVSEVVTDRQREAREFHPPLVVNMVIVDKKRRVSSNQMSPYEYASVLSIRARQIELTNIAYVEFGNMTKVIDIAEKEIASRMCPLSILRKVGNAYERWDVNELEIPFGM
jgi:DNA-directed RNA polymerase subunit K/omega